MFVSVGPMRSGPLVLVGLRQKLPHVQLCAAIAALLAGGWLCITQGRVVAANLPALPNHHAVLADECTMSKSASAAIQHDLPGVHLTIHSPQVYIVHGADTAAIRKQLAQCSPVATVEGGAFAAETRYNLSTDYSFFTDGVQCSVSSAAVNLTLSQTMPHWQEKAAPKIVQHEWQRYLTSITTHEHGHEALDIRYAQQLARDVQTVQAPTCANVRQRVDTIVATRTQQLNAANEAYDQQTNHGATQGAVLH